MVCDCSSLRENRGKGKSSREDRKSKDENKKERIKSDMEGR